VPAGPASWGIAEQAAQSPERPREHSCAIASGKLTPPPEVAFAIVADIRRRAGHFETALAESEDEGTVTTARLWPSSASFARAEDHQCHNSAEAFAAEDLE
jgi:hypothetical protein